MPKPIEQYDTAILGAGAAGLFCAGLLAQSGQRVLVVDHAPSPGRKILISGGGRANFTNLNTRPENFLSENPHFARSALAGYSPEQFVSLVERHGIRYHPKAPGQLFCDGSARELLQLLLNEAANAELRLETRILSVEQTAPHFTLRLRTAGEPETPVTASAVIVATGGLSIPKLGASGFGYELARSFGLAVVPTRPALVPFTFSADDAQRFADLSGVAAEVQVELTTAKPRAKQTTRFLDKLLITHRGLSGPAILQISSYWRPGDTLRIDFAPGQPLFEPILTGNLRREPASRLTSLAAALPRRLAERLHALAPPAGLGNEALRAAEVHLHAWPIVPAGTEGFAKAEVTAGGVSTAELSSTTMESRKIPNLFFIGEVVDVTGHLGGFNFQWAWASAAAAARAIRSR